MTRQGEQQGWPWHDRAQGTSIGQQMFLESGQLLSVVLAVMEIAHVDVDQEVNHQGHIVRTLGGWRVEFFFAIPLGL